MNDEPPGENRRRQASSFVERFESWPPSLLVCTPFLEQNFAHQASFDGALYGAN
jgi:hypothetical protein